MGTSTAKAASSTPPVPPTNDGIEAKVRAYFKDIPVMVLIAGCESKFRQYDKLGDPLDGGAGGMIGIFQIHSKIHADLAQSLGEDVYTVDGNLAYAKRLYNKEGTTPWLSSATCWREPFASVGEISSNLSFGMVSSEVQTLQKILNKAGFMIAVTGPGSPGEETTRFGGLTRAAVRNFQCAKNIVCSGDESSTGYGLVGKKTRAALGVAAKPAPGLVEGASTSTISVDNSAEIARLQALIAELTAQLTALLNKSTWHTI